MATDVCKYFLKGSCHHGKSCPFRHQKAPPGPKSPTQQVPCKYFAQGKCAYGQKCSRSHEVKGRSNAATASSSATPTDSGSSDGVKATPNTKPSSSKSNSGKKKGADPSSSSNVEREPKQELAPSPVIAEERETPPKAVCVFFSSGSCQSGATCPFLHLTETEEAIESDAEPTHTPRRERKTVCKHFLRGRCRLGNECKYDHDDPLDQTTSPVIDNEISPINSGDQFSPSSVSPPSAPRDSPAPIGLGLATPEFDSGFEDMTMPDTTLYSPEISRHPKAGDDSSESPTTAPAVTFNNDSYDQLEKQEDVVELGDYPAVHGKGKMKEIFDPDSDEMVPAAEWEKDQESDRGFSPTPEDSPERIVDDPPEEQFGYPDAEPVEYHDEEEQADHADEEPLHNGGDSEKGQEVGTEPIRKRRGSYYGNGWVDRELGSPLIPSPSAQINNTEPVQPAVEPYPHISEVKLHWSHFADPLADSGIPFCKALAQGKCLQGESCRFRHSLTPQEYTLIFHDQQPNLWTLKRSPATHVVDGQTTSLTQSAVITRAQLPSARPQPESANASSIKECAFFRLGKCRNGDICPFRHVKPPEGHAAPSDSGWGQTQPVSSSSGPKSNRACRFFLNKGFCDNGEACRFKHTKDGENPITSTATSVKGEQNEEQSDWPPWGGNNDAEDVKVAETNAQDDDNGWGVAVDHSGWGDPQEQPTLASSDWPPPDDKPSAFWGVNSDSPCPFFLKGHCRKGERCDRRHDRSNAPTPKHDNVTSFHEGPRSPAPNSAHSQTSGNTGWPVQEYNGQPTRKKINLPCKRLAEGYCRFGDQCDYLHNDNTGAGSAGAAAETLPEWPSTPISPSVEPDPVTNDNDSAPGDKDEKQDPPQASPEPEPIVFDHPVVKTPIMTCEVTVGPDGTPEHIVSASDCNKIVLSGLPPETSTTDVTMLCGKHGHVTQVVNLDSSPTSSDFLVEFAIIAHAVIAARNLNGYIYSGAPLLASLKARIPLTIRNPDAPMLTLQVNWPNPSVSAWTHYPTISKAKSEASRLNDTVYRGYTIKASFMTPPRSQKDSFCTKIERLPADVTEAEVNELCVDNSPLITLSRPTYTEYPVDAISAALDEYRGLESFDLLPGNDQRGTSIAFATFKSEAMARTIMEKLDSRQHAFLGNRSLSIRPAYYSRNRLLREQLEALKNEIDRLVEASNKNCTVQIDEHPDKAFVWVRMYASFDYGPLMHTALEELLAGTVLKDQNGIDLWDDYFDLPSSAKILKQLGTNAYIHCDHPAQKLRAFGGSSDCEDAQNSVLKLVAKVRSQRHEIDIPRGNLHPMINGTLAELKATIGINKVSLDVINSRLIVRGTSADVSKASSILKALNVQPAPGGHGICQVCLQQSVDTITLSCYHNYCTRCLEFMIKQVGHGPVRCIAQGKPSDGQEDQCSGIVPFVVMRNVLSMEEEKEFLASSFYRHVRSNPDQMFFCPSPDCQTAYRRSGEKCVNLKCKFCYSDVCTFCKSLAHLGSSCSAKSVRS